PICNPRSRNRSSRNRTTSRPPCPCTSSHGSGSACLTETTTSSAMSSPSCPSQKRPASGVAGNSPPERNRKSVRSVSQARGPYKPSVASAACPGGVRQAIHVVVSLTLTEAPPHSDEYL